MAADGAWTTTRHDQQPGWYKGFWEESNKKGLLKPTELCHPGTQLPIQATLVQTGAALVQIGIFLSPSCKVLPSLLLCFALLGT